MATKRHSAATDTSVEAQLWRKGILAEWKFDSTEIAMNRELDEKLAQHDRVVLLCGRRMGKSFVLAVRAIEFAIKNPGAQIKYISSTKNNIVDYLIPIFDILLEDCPPDVRPTWISGDFVFRFWNGSRIKLIGTDSKNYKRARGQAAHFTVIDECGFMADLSTTVTSVLAPQALTTGGKMIMASTAPDTPGHEFVSFVIRAREENACVERTIYDRLALGSRPFTAEEEATQNKERLKKSIADSLGEDTAAFRREYLNDLGATESTRSAVPIFTDALAKGTATRPGIVREVTRPTYCHKYTSGDLGFIDFSAFVFGYLAPGNIKAEEPAAFQPTEPPPGAVVIEDELIAFKMLSEAMAPLILDKEKRLWGAEAPLVRVVDGTPEQVERMRRTNLDVVKTRNDKPDVGIDEVQTLMAKGLLIIHPRCTATIACIQAAVWKRDGSRLDRHQVHGHFDALMALVYFVRNLRRHASPTPYGRDAGPRGPGFGAAVSDTVKELRAGFKGRLPFN